MNSFSRGIMQNLQVSKNNFSNSRQMGYFEIKSKIVTALIILWIITTIFRWVERVLNTYHFWGSKQFWLNLTQFFFRNAIISTSNLMHFSISVGNFSKPVVTMPIKNNDPIPNFDLISQQPICKLFNKDLCF